MTTHAAIGTEQATELVLGQMREVLRSRELTATDDFYDAGGDSILAAGLTGRLRRITGIDLPASLVFTYSTAEELGVVLAEESRAK
ncbi:MAG TPA: acyl carrier protein [Streptosporangiaceae bacterium]|nr:acyl carrier protein [Streptosporangiaceae bacterium]